MATVTKPETKIAAEQQFVLYDVSWESYEKILEALADRKIRITYDRGALELMSPSDVHEWLNRLFDRLINDLTAELDIPIRGHRSWTLRKREVKRGLEPDDCYYVQNESRVRGKPRLDIKVDPPPDLAMEIDVTSSSIDRMGIYAALKIPELWRYDGESLFVYRLTPAGEYEETGTSAAFPFLNPAGLLHFIDRRTEMDETTLVRTFRQWMREKFAHD